MNHRQLHRSPHSSTPFPPSRATTIPILVRKHQFPLIRTRSAQILSEPPPALPQPSFEPPIFSTAHSDLDIFSLLLDLPTVPSLQKVRLSSWTLKMLGVYPVPLPPSRTAAPCTAFAPTSALPAKKEPVEGAIYFISCAGHFAKLCSTRATLAASTSAKWSWKTSHGGHRKVGHFAGQWIWSV